MTWESSQPYGWIAVKVGEQKKPYAQELCSLASVSNKRLRCADFACLPQTLGHLEKAVVLELTLKHVKALTSLLEQQQQKILSLQSGMQIGERQTFAYMQKIIRQTNV